MKYINMLLLSFIALGLYAQQQTEPKRYSLKDAVSYAKSNNYALKSTKLDITAAQQKVREVTAMGLPNVSASGSFTHNIEVPVQVLPNFFKETLVGSSVGQTEANYRIANPGTLTPAQEAELASQKATTATYVGAGIPNQISAGFGVPFTAVGNITASQLIFDGTFLMGLKASKEFVNLSRINATRGEIETEVNVSKAYYLALLMQTNVNLLDKNIDALSKTASEFEKLSASGLVDKIESDRIKLQLNSLTLQRAKIADQQKISMMVLKFQMGLNVNDNIILSDSLQTLYQQKQNVATAEKADFNKRPEYQIIKQQERLNILDKKRYQYANAPSLSGFFTHQQSSFGNNFSELGNTWFPGTFWGLNLRIPIYEGSKKQSQIQQAKIALEKNKNDIANLENAIEQEVFTARTTHQRATEQISIQEKNLALAQEVFNRVETKYKNGLGSSLELTNSQNDLETARANYLNTVYEFFVAEIDLQKALGNIK